MTLGTTATPATTSPLRADRAQLSIRIDEQNPLHHLWNNHGVWWIHYTLTTAEGRIRRVRRSLATRDRAEAVARRDARLALLAREGEVAR